MDSSTRPNVLDYLARLVWLDGSPLIDRIEPYRLQLFHQFFEERDSAGRPRYNMCVSGRAKKNAKTLDAVLAALWAVMDNSPHGSQVYLLASDQDQAADDLDLGKKLIRVNPALDPFLEVKKNVIERRDGGGYIEVLPAQDVAGSHGKTYRLAVFDEIHTYRNWDLLEAMQFDPTRPDSQQWITSYASIHHRPGVPLFDLFSAGKAGTDPRMLFSWYAADYTTDPEFEDKSPEERANPSAESWEDPDYLEQQQRRLPGHKYRRLHLNLPGLPEGSAYQPEPIFDAVDRGVTVRPPEDGIDYRAFVDMSGGSRDDAVLGIGHKDRDGRAVIDRVVDQGKSPPFDPVAAVGRFVRVLREYGCTKVVGDRYAGETFRSQFEKQGISYTVSDRTAHELYEDLEPALNGHKVALLDEPKLEQQLLGLVWRGAKIDHQGGEFDDWSNAVAGVVGLVLKERGMVGYTWGERGRHFRSDLPPQPRRTARQVTTGREKQRAWLGYFEHGPESLDDQPDDPNARAAAIYFSDAGNSPIGQIGLETEARRSELEDPFASENRWR